ncbi:MAG: nuclear transport factor 2 family protein [Gammaproteobacteria bacterium]
MSIQQEDKEAIRDLISNYCYYADSADADRFVAQFTEDCVWDGGAIGRFEGRAALHAFIAGFAKGPRTMRHLTLNTVITGAGTQAQAKSYIVVTNQSGDAPALMMTGFYDDVFVKQGGRWLFKSRSIPTDPTVFSGR